MNNTESYELQIIKYCLREQKTREIDELQKIFQLFISSVTEEQKNRYSLEMREIDERIKTIDKLLIYD